MGQALPIIRNRGEFIDALRALARGHVLVKMSDHCSGCSIDGAMVYHSYETLERYGLIREFDNPHGFPTLQYYRLTEAGRDFAHRASAAWRSRPLHERLAARLFG